jgi:hypothetical protein
MTIIGRNTDIERQREQSYQLVKEIIAPFLEQAIFIERLTEVGPLSGVRKEKKSNQLLKEVLYAVYRNRGFGHWKWFSRSQGSY